MKIHISRPALLWIILLLVHLFFLAVTLVNPPSSLPDSNEYQQASGNIYANGVLYSGDLAEPEAMEKYTRRPPLYPLLLGAELLTGTEISVQLIQIFISLISILLASRIFRRARQPFIGLILLLVTPAQFIYSNLIMSEILFQLFVVLMAWSAYHYFLNDRIRQVIGTVNWDGRTWHPAIRYIWLFNIFLTLGMATKPVLLPFALLMIIVSLVLSILKRDLTFIFALLLPLLWISLYGVRNYTRTGSVQYSSIQTTNLVNYNLRYYITSQEGADSAAAAVDSLYAACGSSVEYREKVHCLEQGTREILLEKPLKYGIFHLKGCVRCFLDPGRFDLVTFFHFQNDEPGFLRVLNEEGLTGALFYLREQGWLLVTILAVIVVFKLVKVTGFLFYLFIRSELFSFRIFLVILVGYMVLVTGPLGASRFLLPVELLIIWGAARGWSSLLYRKREGIAGQHKS